MRILVIGLSNVGDGILMSPVVARLSAAHPSAELTLVVGTRAQAVFERDPRITHLIALEDGGGWRRRLHLLGVLWRTRPHVLVDLRKTILPLLWRPWLAWRYLLPLPADARHRRRRHLQALERQVPGLSSAGEALPSIAVAESDAAHIEHLLVRWGVDLRKPLVVMAPSARSHIKRWYPDRFAAVADRLIQELGATVVVTGEPEEGALVNEMLDAMQQRAYSAVGLTTLPQLAALMRRARLVIANDSAALHLGCAAGATVLSLFGPTDPSKYGPTGPRDRVIQRRLVCVPCEAALCRFNHECMRFISADEVFAAARSLLA